MGEHLGRQAIPRSKTILLALRGTQGQHYALEIMVLLKRLNECCRPLADATCLALPRELGAVDFGKCTLHIDEESFSRKKGKQTGAISREEGDASGNCHHLTRKIVTLARSPSRGVGDPLSGSVRRPQQLKLNTAKLSGPPT